MQDLAWVREHKTKLYDLGGWERRALLNAARVLPTDERDHWLKLTEAQLPNSARSMGGKVGKRDCLSVRNRAQNYRCLASNLVPRFVPVFWYNLYQSGGSNLNKNSHLERWRPLGESNPCCRDENPVS